MQNEIQRTWSQSEPDIENLKIQKKSKSSLGGHDL